MEIRVLEYFLAVAREENITKAAESLFITQPTLSRQLSALEQELGCELFIRGGNKRTVLTEAGLLLKRRAEEIVELTEKTSQEFSKPLDVLEGTISIGAAESFSAKIIADVMKIFLRDYPKVKFDIFSNNAASVSEKIDKGLLDFGILIEPIDLLKYEWLRLKEKETWGILMRSDCELAKKDFVTYQDIVALPILCSKQIASGEFDSWFKGSSDSLNIIATYNLINNAAMLVEAGIGYAISIDGATYMHKTDKLVFKPFYPSKVNTSVLVWKKLPLNCAICNKFIDTIKMLLEHN